MRKTLLAIGFAVLVSMMLAPHGGKGGVEGWGPFFSAQAFHVSSRVWYGNAGRVMIDMLALEMVFLAVLFAVVVNIRWSRPGKKNPKPTFPENLLNADAPPTTPPAEHHRRPRGYMTACTNCRRRIIVSPLRDQTGRVFCSNECLAWFNGPRRFCAKCVTETTKDSVGGLVRINGIGNTLMGYSSKYATCGSVVRREVITVLFLPLFPRKHYRVLYAAPKTFYSRQIKENHTP